MDNKPAQEEKRPLCEGCYVDTFKIKKDMVICSRREESGPVRVPFKAKHCGLFSPLIPVETALE